MNGSLYAGIGDWEDPQLENSQTPGAQVLRLDSPTSSWVEDQDFNQLIPGTSGKYFAAVANLGTAHFDHDFSGNPITPVDVLMAGTWNLYGGVIMFEKTTTTGAGPSGTWLEDTFELVANAPGGFNTNQVRSFASYTDFVTGIEMAFAALTRLASTRAHSILQRGIFNGVRSARPGALSRRRTVAA